MASAARRGPRLRKKYNRGGRQVGVDRAQQLTERRDLSKTDVKSMHSFLACYAANKTHKSVGFHRLLLWGGDADKHSADGKVKNLDG